MLLARMAVASGFQGEKLGAGLLKDAMTRTSRASQIAGIRAFVVHAKDDEARAFYERFDFIASPSAPLSLGAASEGCPSAAWASMSRIRQRPVRTPTLWRLRRIGGAHARA
jgi:predicted N-acetyltransferase YhbS